MDTVPVPLLEGRSIFHSRDAEETRAFLRCKEFRFEVMPRDAQRLDVHINGVYLPGTFIGYIQYGSAVTVRATPARDDYWIQLPVRGCIEITTGHASLACNARQAAVCAPMQAHALRSEAGSARFNVSLTQGALIRQLTTLLGDIPRQVISFHPMVDLSTGYGRSLARLLHFAASELECEDSMLWQPSAMSRIEELLITGLLLSQPHNYSEALRRLDRPVAPRDVKRAIEYIYAHLGEGITLSDVIEQSRVPGRTLFKHFRDFTGVSPMRYLSNARFDQVHEALRNAQPGETVSQIAMHCGFSHMGRFSAEYRQRFAETPSSTLSRGRHR
jgi:AraC-like DNA-binding protein